MRSEEFRVSVVEFADRKCYMLQWKDPITGRKRSQSSGVERTGRQRDRDKAVKEAQDLQRKLETGRCAVSSKIAWDEFRDRYEREHVGSLAEGTRGKVKSVLNTVERLLSPSHLRSLTSERLSCYQALLREEGRSETTIAGHLAHIAAALNWATEIGLLVKAPKVKRPKRAKNGKMAKGRAISGEEFDRLLVSVEAGFVEYRRKVRPRPKQDQPEPRTRKPRKPGPPMSADVVEAWRNYLRGLWYSGLRLGESLELSWDEGAGLWVDLTSGRFPVLRILAESEKGNEDRLLPITPDFAEYLVAIPESDRHGRVFKLPCRRGEDRPLDIQYVSAVVCCIGAAARVVVNRDHQTDHVKFASAHDLRRSFGDRWSRKVMPVVLQQLMRHTSIETTLKYYCHADSDLTAQAVWDSCGSTWRDSKVGHRTLSDFPAEATVANQPVEGDVRAVE